MLKKLGTLMLAAAACGTMLIPQAAKAQDGYGYTRPYTYYDHDRNRDRHEKHEWREHERRERRWRDREWREHEWRERERRGYGPAYYGAYPPSMYFEYGYNR